MSLARAIIKRVVPLPKLEDYDRFLFIGPHPDDLELGAGATAAKLCAMGKTVRFLICIDGRFGITPAVEGTAPGALVGIRQEEARRAAGKLGVRDVVFLGLCDGGFYEIKELEEGIFRQISDFQPDVIFAPDPCVTNECHKDHLNVGNAARNAAVFAPNAGIMEKHGCVPSDVKAIAFYMTAKFNSYVNTSGFLSRQLEALSEFPSQFPEGSGDRKAFFTYVKLRSALNGARIFSAAAEGFRVLGGIHMHCLPEMGD